MIELQQGDAEEQVVVFDLASESYGVDISHVQEIIRPPAITAVPCAPEYVEGVVNLRGRVIPVINLRNRFGLPTAERGRSSRIVVLEIGGHTIGAAVDAVTEVLRVPQSAVEAPGATLAGPETAHLRGIAKLDERLIILLDLERIVETIAQATN
ncbi:MAG: chemotaxis protein CheW [Dehalococcoidia bacterium]